MRRLTPDEIRRRHKAVKFDLLPMRLVLATGTFLLTLRKQGLCGAVKEARMMWKLQIS